MQATKWPFLSYLSSGTLTCCLPQIQSCVAEASSNNWEWFLPKDCLRNWSFGLSRSNTCGPCSVPLCKQQLTTVYWLRDMQPMLCMCQEIKSNWGQWDLLPRKCDRITASEIQSVLYTDVLDNHALIQQESTYHTMKNISKWIFRILGLCNCRN